MFRISHCGVLRFPRISKVLQFFCREKERGGRFVKVRTARGRGGGAETVWTVCDDFAVGERPPPSPPFRRLRRRVRPSKLRLRTRFQAKKGGERKFSGEVLWGKRGGRMFAARSKEARRHV